MLKLNKKYLAFLCFILFNPFYAHAFEMGDPELIYEGPSGWQSIKYACTGVGESRQDPRWEKYPLKLTFTASGTAYISSVEVKIKDQKGDLAFEAKCNSPWLVVNLKPGSYRVEATALEKYPQKASFKINSGSQTSQVIRFPEIKSGSRE